MTIIPERFNSEQYNYSEVKNAYIPDTVYVPLLGPDGKAYKSIVEVNSNVVEGQMIGSSTMLAAVVHSPLPGVLTGFKDISMPDGKKGLAAIIKTEGPFSYLGKKLKEHDWTVMTPAQICDCLADKGVVNTFEIPVSLGEQIDSIIKVSNNGVMAVRLYDLDPCCRTDRCITKNKFHEVLLGSVITAKTLNAKKVFIFYTKSQSKEILENKQIIEDSFHQITSEVFFIQVLDNRYPTGKNREMSRQINKKQKVKVDLFIDSTTAFDVFEAVVNQKPVLDRFIHLSGDALKKPSILRARVGTPIRKLFEECNGFYQIPYKIIINGIMQGIAISDPDTPVTKNMKSIIVLLKSNVPNQKQVHCIRCGNCHRICPFGIQPDKLFSKYFFNTEINPFFLEQMNLCTSCGLCNTVCSARLPLSQIILLLRTNKK